MSNDITQQPHAEQSNFVLDMLVSLAASAVAVLFVRWQYHATFGFERYFVVWIVCSIIASAIAFLVAKTHKIVLRYLSTRSLYKFMMAVAYKTILLGLALLLQLCEFQSVRVDVTVLLTDMMLTLVMLICTNTLVQFIVNGSRQSVEGEVDKLTVLIYGVSDKSVSQALRLQSSNHYYVLGFLTRASHLRGALIQEYKVYTFSTEEDIERLQQQLGIQGILFATTADSDSETGKLLPVCLRHGIHLLTSPKLQKVEQQPDDEDFPADREPLSMEVQRALANHYIPYGMSSIGKAFKRFNDLFFSGIGIIVCSPFMFICWLALKISDKGPALFAQERIGYRGKPFKIYKFRTMRLDAEAYGPQLYSGDDDPRLTKVGGFLRRHHLDEMPQLFNVFLGQMSFVGYRPERQFYIDKIIEKDPRYIFLYQTRPGVTSYATLKNGYTDTFEKMLRRLEFDLYYLRHACFWFDVKVIFGTVYNVFTGKII